jgi:hypothetical protein
MKSTTAWGLKSKRGKIISEAFTFKYDAEYEADVNYKKATVVKVRITEIKKASKK